MDKKNLKKHIQCQNPKNILKKLLEFKVPDIIKKSNLQYAFTGLSAIEIWSDFSYVLRGFERSPYFIKVLKKDLNKWKQFFNKNNIPNYVNRGSTIGEFVILIPVSRLDFTEKNNLKVETLKNTLKIAKKNNGFSYPYKYMREKYALATT